METSPADDLQIREVGLPKLVWGGRRIGEAIGRLHQDEGRARDQAMVLQEPINGGFGHKAALRVREVDGELTRRQVRLLKGQIGFKPRRMSRRASGHCRKYAGASCVQASCNLSCWE